MPAELTPFQHLFTHIRQFIPFSAADELAMLPHVRHEVFKKKEDIVKEGQVCRGNYFILKGCCRLYFLNAAGQEQTIQFAIENWWISDYHSREANTPSPFYIQAIEATNVAVIDKKEEDELFATLPGLERYFRLIHQRAFSATLRRVHFMQDQSGEELYQHFVELFPEFVQRVPQYMLASFLGFTPEFLSKIRAKKR
jgi:CRP/FNR family transcriptional regulator